MEGNSLFAYMTVALLPEYRAPLKPGVSAAAQPKWFMAKKGCGWPGRRFAISQWTRVSSGD